MFFLEDIALFLNFAEVIEINRHIEILLLSNDCVIVPGFGGFMAHYVAARKDEADGSFLPPIRNIGFNPKVTVNDSLLAQSYVDSYDISYPEACKRVEADVEELKRRVSTDGWHCSCQRGRQLRVLPLQGRHTYTRAVRPGQFRHEDAR